MELNKISKNLFFKSSYISKLEIENNLSEYNEHFDKKLTFNIDTNPQKGEVTLFFDIAVGNDKETFKMKLKIIGTFTYNKTEISLEEFDDLLHLNAAALVYSIARGKIESLTANIFNNGKITLPIVNMFDYYK